jgi:DNA mismatch endonuclease (patch repair protein)
MWCIIDATDMGLSRAEQMSRIRGRDTGPERVLRRCLRSAALGGYRLHHRTPAGRPDVVYPGRRVAVFIDGCFWHGCPRHYVRPGSRCDFWAAKLIENVDRDRRQTAELESAGWRVVRGWEHEVWESPLDLVVDVWRALNDSIWRPRSDWRVVRVEELDPASRLERRFEETLRAPIAVRSADGRRITAKWKRPSVY